jgi:hypothetical protein
MRALCTATFQPALQPPTGRTQPCLPTHPTCDVILDGLFAADGALDGNAILLNHRVWRCLGFPLARVNLLLGFLRGGCGSRGLRAVGSPEQVVE